MAFPLLHNLSKQDSHSNLQAHRPLLVSLERPSLGFGGIFRFCPKKSANLCWTDSRARPHDFFVLNGLQSCRSGDGRQY